MMRYSSIVGVVLFTLVLGVIAYAQSTEISDVTISEISDSSAKIQWKTNVETDATVNFGLDDRVGVVRDPAFDKTDHALTIDDLDPATTYYFRVVSADASGNRSTTGNLIFTTKSSSQTPKIIKEIEKIKDPEELKKIQEQVNEQLDIQPPSIVGPPSVTVESDTAEISWSTDRESSSMVLFAPENEYSANSANPYSQSQGDPREYTTKHSVTVQGLEPNTLYHFAVSSEDSAGLTGQSEDNTFKTKSLLPQIINPKVSRVQESSATVSWTTNIPTRGIVEYTNTRSKVIKLAGNPVYATSHSLLLADLEFGSRYSVVIKATNEAGDEVVSKPITFITVRDVIAPAISKVNNESTLFPGEEVKIQTIISWETDEAATCQVFYSQGLGGSAGGEGESMPKETNPVTTHTQVIVGFASATVYQFWLVCDDPAGNETRSEDYVLITPVKEKSIIDIILENFEGTFGWLKNVGG